MKLAFSKRLANILDKKYGKLSTFYWLKSSSSLYQNHFLKF